MPANVQSKPHSTLTKLASYKVKEEVISRAWQRKQIQCNNERFHHYPPAILKKHAEHSQVKKKLKEEKIKFQTPYPARLRVFYAEEATSLSRKATGIQTSAHYR